MEQEELHEVVQLPILRNFIMGFCLSESPGCIGGYKTQPAFVVLTCSLSPFKGSYNSNRI